MAPRSSADALEAGGFDAIPVVRASSEADLRSSLGRAETVVHLAGANLAAANLANADLTFADLRGADLTGSVIVLAKLKSANLTGANLTGAALEGTNLRGATLTHANLDGTNFDGAILTEVIWPDDAPIPEGWMRHPLGRLMDANADASDLGN